MLISLIPRRPELCRRALPVASLARIPLALLLDRYKPETLRPVGTALECRAPARSNPQEFSHKQRQYSASPCARCAVPLLCLSLPCAPNMRHCRSPVACYSTLAPVLALRLPA